MMGFMRFSFGFMGFFGIYWASVRDFFKWFTPR